MNEHPLREDIFAILRLLSSRDDLTQRDLSTHLNISLGKTNYMLKQLIKAGLLEIKNLAVRNHRVKKIKYVLTYKGMEEKIKLTHHFLKEKEAEYNLIKKEWDKVKEHASIS